MTDALARTLKKGDRFTVDGVEHTVMAAPLVSADSVVIQVEGRSLVTLAGKASVPVVRYVKPGAILHARHEWRGRLACGRSGGAVAGTPDDITCPSRDCQRIKRDWQNGRKRAAEVAGGAGYGEHATWVFPFGGPITVTAGDISYTVATPEEAATLESTIQAISYALSAISAVAAERERHPEVTEATA